ncbi:zebrafish testis-expressed 38 isoform X2 [Denticeps clupeoides]|uniref:zebrafish testis-expressed 38 isoform X2 n=1 Tax=Denticeps clupeoides TaxID=299321 RepID=UPI0010A580BF|nr:HORMA domain-containing protein 1-like isoform X2 [Denticeps clupeoides]
MASAVRPRRSRQSASEWTGLFHGDIRTQEQSLVFVKRMMALATSSITYLRGIFPEGAYCSRYLEDLSVKILKEDSSCEGARKIVKWMMGSFDALDKSYLQIVFIGVYTDPKSPNHIIESYQFKFTYSESGPQMDILRNNDVGVRVTMEDTKKASVLLIRKLFLLMQNLSVLPGDVLLNMKLYYYDDVTPPDYEPPGFRKGVYDCLWFEGTAVHCKVGELCTPYHGLKVRVAVEQGRLAAPQEGTEKPRPQDPGAELPGKENVLSDDGDESVAQFKKPVRNKRKRLGSRRAGRKPGRTSVRL